MTDPLTAAKWLGDPSVDIEAARRCLPADEPAPGLELDVSDAGARFAADETESAVEVDEAALAALRRGLSLLTPEAAATLLARLPAPPAAPSSRHESGAIQSVGLRLAPALGPWLAPRLPADAVETLRDGSLLYRLEVTDPAALLPWLLRLGPRVEVVEPRALRLQTADEAAALAERHRLTPPEI